MFFRRILKLLMLRLGQIDLLWWLLIVFLLLIEVAILHKKRRTDCFPIMLLWSLFFPYLLFILAATVFSREIVPQEYSIISFNIATAWMRGPGIYGQIDTATEVAMNVLMLVPAGYLLMRLSNKVWLAMAVALLITLFIEIMQLITRRGFFELADILLNMTGAMCGCGICKLQWAIKDRFLL